MLGSTQVAAARDETPASAPEAVVTMGDQAATVTQPRRDRGPDGRFVSPAGPRRPGGQAGNLNAVRNPWESYWSRRALKPEHRWALALVRDYVPALVAEKGGADVVSFAEQRVMELAATARVCWALALAAGDLEAVARFMAQERAALESVGLERRPKPAPTLAEIIAEHDAREAAARAGHDAPGTDRGTNDA